MKTITLLTITIEVFLVVLKLVLPSSLFLNSCVGGVCVELMLVRAKGNS